MATVENQLVPFNFYWNDGGEQVSVAGSFNNWTPVPMNETADNSFELTLDVPRGEIEFKFIVDGVWKESNEYDTKLSSMNSLNNVKLIDIMERANHPEQPQHLEDNSPAAGTQNTTNNININTERVQEDTSNSQQHKDLVTDTNIQNQSTMKRTVPDRKEHSTKSCRGMCCVS
eukprot:jgi/Galph1/2617/GphlegSOOS_G1312.1